MTRAARFILALGLGLAVLLLRMPSLSMPLDRDEGEFASLAWLWSDGHGVPYRDWVEQKPPATLGLHALAQAAFGDGVRGLRVLSLLWILATVLALALLIARGLGGGAGARRAAWLAGLLAAVLLSGARTQALAANTETWLALPLALALWTAFGGAPARGRLLAAGAFIGLAGLFKQPALAALLAVAVALKPGEQRLLPSLGWLTLGAALPWLAAFALFAAQGAGAALLDCTWLYNQAYVAGPRDGRALLGLLAWLAPELGGFAGLAALGWIAAGPGPLRRALGAWLLTGLALLLASGRAYPHYAIGLLPPLAGLAGVGLALPRASRGWRLRWALLALALGGFAWTNAAVWAASDGGRRSEALFGIPHFAAAPAAARRLAELCPPGKTVLQWGDEAELYYLARRVPATRFLYTYPLTGEAPPWPDGDLEFRGALFSESVGAVVVTKPADLNNALQQEIRQVLSDDFVPAGSVPPYLMGVRRR